MLALPGFIDEENRAEKLSDLPQIMMLGSGRAGISTKPLDSGF